MRLTFAQGSSLLVLAWLTACGGGDLKDNALEPKGGTLLLPGGVVLTVPAGALEDNQAFDFQAVEPPLGQGFVAVGPFVEVGPADVEFQKPVTLTFPFGDAVGGVLGVAWSTGGSGFERLEGALDPVARSLTIEVTRLGTGGPARWPGDTLCCAVDGRALAIGEVECTGRAGVALAEAACACAAEADCDDGDPCTTQTCGADGACSYDETRQSVCGDGCRQPAEACETNDDCSGEPGVQCVDCVCVDPDLTGPFHDPWTVIPAGELEAPEGFRWWRVITHCHSPYSHDACDGEPRLEDGSRNEQCFEEVRAGMCQTAQDAVFLSDHRGIFADYEYPEVLLYAEGDTLIEREGLPVANRVACPEGHSVIVAAGTESEMMPLGLERHVGDTPEERSYWYGQGGGEAIEKFHDVGALVFLQHTEEWPAESVDDWPIDGIEIYNVHFNMMERLIDAAKLWGQLQKDPDSMPAIELALLALVEENTRDLEHWARSSAVKRLTGVMATDAHRNVFQDVSPDGERLDSFRRMMHWFSNLVLLPADLDPAQVDDRTLKAALGEGRTMGSFDILGYPSGFDFHAEGPAGRVEMGGVLRDVDEVTLVVKVPRVARLDPRATPPQITTRLLKADPDNEAWVEVAKVEGTTQGELRATVGPGTYRAEVRMVPHHLTPWLGPEPDKWLRPEPFVWVYANPIYVSPSW